MYKKALISVDVSIDDDTQNLLARAKEMVSVWDIELHVVTVVPTFGMAIVSSYFDEGFESNSRAEAAKRLDSAVAQAGLTATPHVLSGTVYDEVIGLARRLKPELILIGAHRPELRDYLLGSNAARIVRHSDASVLVVRSD